MSKNSRTQPPPPLGVMPRWRWLELNGHHHDRIRYRELIAAIERYNEGLREVPVEWTHEVEDISTMYDYHDIKPT